MYQYPRQAMSRGTLILDENVEVLKSALQNKNFHVFTPEPSMKDIDIKKDLLFNKIFVTNNDKDFVGDERKYSYSIIKIEQDILADRDAAATAISAAIRDHQVQSLHKRGVLFHIKIFKIMTTHTICSELKVLS
jgi:hypothetical protein